MLLKINKFLSSDNVSMAVNENFVIDDEEFLEETRLDKNILLSGEIFKIDDSLTFSGRIEYTLTDECARCLKEFNNRINYKFFFCIEFQYFNKPKKHSDIVIIFIYSLR